ncbi:MAG: hypothetical protein ABI456_08815, partial [Ktedonobacteraceae bacterium]
MQVPSRTGSFVWERRLQGMRCRGDPLRSPCYISTHDFVSTNALACARHAYDNGTHPGISHPRASPYTPGRS